MGSWIRAQPRPSPAPAEANLALSPPAEHTDYNENDVKVEWFMNPAQSAAEQCWSNRHTNPHAARGMRDVVEMLCLL